MRDRILGLFSFLSQRHAKGVLVLTTCATVLVGLAIPRLRISTSHSDLASSTHPEQARYLAFLDEFGAANSMVVVLEGSPADVKDAAPAFARAFAQRTDFVRDVFHRVDTDILLRNVPLFMPVTVLERAKQFLSENTETVKAAAGVGDLPTLLTLVGDGLGGKLSGLDVGPTKAPAALNGIRKFFAEWQAWLDDADRREIDLTELAGRFAGERASTLTSDGFLTSHDGTLLFLFVQPASASDDVKYLAPFRDALRATCDGVVAREGGAAARVKYAFTGMPAHVLAEVETIRSDVGRAAGVSLLLVLLILLCGFRSWKTVLVAVTPLCCGMIMTLGVIALTVGRLNLVSSSFLAVLFGIGIDFAIYLVRRTEEELGNGRDLGSAIQTAVTESGRGVLTGGTSTGLSFLAVGWCDFIGFSELGITAGIGVLVVMTTTFLMLPCLMALFGVRPRVYRTEYMAGSVWKGKERHYLYPIVVVSFALAVYGLVVMRRIPFDFNALHLLPQDCESTVYQLRMQDESGFQMTFAAVTTPTLSGLRDVERELRQLPSVSRIDSLARIIPDGQGEKLAILADCARLLPPAKTPAKKPVAPGGERYVRALEALYEGFEDMQEDAFAGGHAEIVTAVEGNLSAMAKLLGTLSDSAGAEQARTRTAAFERALLARLAQAREIVQGWTALQPVTETTYPPSMVSRFRSSRGNYVAYVFPSGSVWDLDFLDAFIGDVRRITPNVTGFPATVRVNARMAVSGLRQAMVYGLLMIVVLLAVDFRRLRPVLLSLIPLGVGMLWVQALMYAMGMTHNYASMAGMPLLMGLGVVYGVHIVHRWLEDPRFSAFAAARTSGRGVAFAALTTVAGLFSITFARHRGVSAFGTVILMGVLACLASALLVLPAVIDLLYEKPEEATAHDNGRPGQES